MKKYSNAWDLHSIDLIAGTDVILKDGYIFGI
jgi:hypothetical protein